MFFRSSLALLLIFSFVSINAAPPNMDTNAGNGASSSSDTNASNGAQSNNSGELFSQVIACALEKLKPTGAPSSASSASPPASVKLQTSTVGDEHPAPLIVFDECIRKVYKVNQTSAGSSSGATPQDIT